MAVLATLSIVIGNIGAIGQSSLKRMLAWSGVAQAGYILAGVVVASELGTKSVVFYLLVYLVMNVAAFAVVIARERETGVGRRLSGRRPSPVPPTTTSVPPPSNISSTSPRSRKTECFAPLCAASGSLPRAGGGLGLGLALVRGLVELHGGSVTARSAGPDQGSEFEVRLPAIPKTTVPALPLPGRDGPSPPAQPRHVLVVEDSADVRDALRALLEVWGHHVEVAEDGPVGVEMARLNRPEIALVDIGLPGFDGYQVAERLRAAPAGRGVFLVALSGYGQAEDRRRALAAGFDVHLLKPVDPEELARVLAEMPASGGASRS